MCGPSNAAPARATSLPRKARPVPPTASTFINRTTVRPDVCNVGGHTDPQAFAQQHRGTHATFGRPRGDYAGDSRGFLRSGAGPRGASTLPAISRHEYACERKQPVARRGDAPIHGLRSAVDFVAENRRAAIDSVAPQPPGAVDYLSKPSYGQVPAYLQRTKAQVAREKAHLEQTRSADKEQQSANVLSGPALEELREQLVRKYNEVQGEYQRITHITRIDTLGLKRRKEGYEKILDQLEKDLALLKPDRIVVVDR